MKNVDELRFIPMLLVATRPLVLNLLLLISSSKYLYFKSFDTKPQTEVALIFFPLLGSPV